MNQIDTRMTWRRWLLVAVFIGITIVVISRFTGLKDLAAAMSEAYWPWLVLGVAIHAGYFVMYAKLYQLCFDVVGVESTTAGLLPVMFSALFANTIIPSGGTAGGAIYVTDAAQRGQSGARAAVGTVLVMLSDLATLIPFIAYSLFFLAARGSLRWFVSVTTGMFLAFLILMTAGLILADRRPDWLRRVLERLRTLINIVAGWFKHPDLVGEDWPERNAHDLATASDAIVRFPRKVTLALGWAFFLHFVNLAGLFAFFRAFRQPVQLGTLVSGFAIGIVFFVINVLPQGVAATEGIMALIFTSQGVPSETSVAIVLAFRAVNFYLPIVFGFFLVQYLIRLERSRGDPRRESSAAAADPCEDPEEGAG
jgi:uncharacterized protein (TIRG00374 family)